MPVETMTLDEEKSVTKNQAHTECYLKRDRSGTDG